MLTPWLWNSSFSFLATINPGAAWLIYPIIFILVLIFYIIAIIFFIVMVSIFFVLTFAVWLLAAVVWVIAFRQCAPGATTSEASIQFLKFLLMKIK